MPTITIGNGDRNDRLGSFVRLQRPKRATQQTESFLAQKGGRKREERVALAPNSGVGLEEGLRPRWPLDRGGKPLEWRVLGSCSHHHHQPPIASLGNYEDGGFFSSFRRS